MKNEYIRPLQQQQHLQKELQKILKIAPGVKFCIFSPLKCQNEMCRVREPGDRRIGTNISTIAKINILFASNSPPKGRLPRIKGYDRVI